VNPPKIGDNVGFSTKLKHFDSLGRREYDASPIGLGININLKCINTGNSLAKILNTFWTDTVSGEAELRAILIDGDRRQGSMVPVSLNGYYKTQELSAGDTINIETELSVASFKDKTFTLHFLILYQNEAGALFDTYYWARFKAGPFRMFQIDTLIDGKRDRFVIPFFPFMRASLIKLIDSHTSTKLYSSEVAMDIINFTTTGSSKQPIKDIILYISWLATLLFLFTDKILPKNKPLFLKRLKNSWDNNQMLKESWRVFPIQSLKLMLKLKERYLGVKRYFAIAKIAVLIFIIPSILMLIFSDSFTAFLEAIGLKEYSRILSFDFFQSIWLYDLSVAFSVSLIFFVVSTYITFKLIELGVKTNSNYKIIFLLILDFCIALVLMQIYKDIETIHLSSVDMIYVNSDRTLTNYSFLDSLWRIDLSMRHLFYNLQDMFTAVQPFHYFDISAILSSLLLIAIIIFFTIIKLFDKYVFSFTYRVLKILLNIKKGTLVTISLIVSVILTAIAKWPF
jgi:hypothetical protein